jgi:hypothetical protein
MERSAAMDLLNALYIALGIAPEGERAGGADAKSVKVGIPVRGAKGGLAGESKVGGGKLGSDQAGGGQAGDVTPGGKGK